MGVAGIYMIQSPSGRIYIGQSRNIRKRFYAYSRKTHFPKTKLYSSIIKYGFINHIVKILHELPKDIERSVMDEYEVLYINQYSECGFILLNMKDGGGGNNGLNEESRKKIGDANRGRPKTKYFMDQMRERMIGKQYSLGYRHTEESKKKISERSSGHIHPMARKVVDIKTGKSYSYLKEAAADLGINYNTLVGYVTGLRKNKTNIRYA